MPTRIRICNESEARLLVQDGSFLDYLRHWDEQFSQMGRMEWLNRFGINLTNYKQKSWLCSRDYLDFFKAGPIDNTGLFEVGDSIVLKKEMTCWSLFHKIDNIWVQDRAFQSLDDLTYCSGHFLFPDIHPEVLASEDEIRNTHNLKGFARKLRLYPYEEGCYYKFGKHEIWEMGPGVILVYGKECKTGTWLYRNLKSIESHIRLYGKTTQVSH